MNSRVKRRLTTVLCADVSSYTALMERDEAGTLERLRANRRSMSALIERHDGRVINTWGDALIAEFPSVLEAVHSAVEIQQELAGRNRDLGETEQMWFRIGINLGDVMVEGDDVYGEGVNIAARLQQIAEPGGIMISRPVYDQVKNKLAFDFDFLGDQTVKNVTEPVPSFAIRFEGAPKSVEQRADKPTEHSRTPPIPGVTLDEPSLWARFKSLPALIKVASILVGFFFALNLASGLWPIWFHWPSIPMVAIILIYFSLRRSKEKAP